MYGLCCALLMAIASHRVLAIDMGYYNPVLLNGSMMTDSHEPVNVIISNRSDPRVMVESIIGGGLYNYLAGAGFGGECFGLHMGGLQSIDLGDGTGTQIQKNILRYQYFHDPYLGTCLESIYGGNHVRVFKQETSGAYFLATSAEQDSTTHHNLGWDAYDIGRNYFIGNSTNVTIPEELTTHSTFSGHIEQNKWRYMTNITFVDGLLDTNRSLWNHFAQVQEVGEEVSDGLVAILEIHVDKL
ncbi:hypothetical protein IAR55_006066 [Kwoniella newhampshirensis]|uniref:Uncharacterized protein n=1 Tax=Kwoniella newhampshirensis TaxID=1651941 RepID=A0AAW0YRX0_9TREE